MRAVEELFQNLVMNYKISNLNYSSKTIFLLSGYLLLCLLCLGSLFRLLHNMKDMYFPYSSPNSSILWILASLTLKETGWYPFNFLLHIHQGIEFVLETFERNIPAISQVSCFTLLELLLKEKVEPNYFLTQMLIRYRL